MRTTSTPLALLGPLIAIAVSGCSSKVAVPDIGDMYTQSAMYHGPDRNPVIVIPGILGSKLMEPSMMTTVWGAFGGDYANPTKPDGAALCALPMKRGVPLEDLRDEVYPDGSLDRIKLKLIGLPFHLKAYANILGSLGVGGYRDQQLAAAGAVDYGDEHFTCFQFAYDWRRSNAENAQRLHEFILDKKGYVEKELERRFGTKTDVKFDIVAHSMGGLVTRYFMRYGSAELPPDGTLPELTWEGAELVDRVVLVSTPNAGSLEALHNLVEGMKLAPILPRYSPVILGTLPALYELLPRPRHVAVVEANDTNKPLDIYDADLWIRLGWGLASPDADKMLKFLLPDETEPAARREIALDHLRKSLYRAEQFAAAIDLPATPPDNVSLHLFAGDAVPTESLIGVDMSSGKLETLAHAPGDGTVPRLSALMDERQGGRWTPGLITPIDWARVIFIFTDHIGMTKDPAFTDNILYLLLEEPKG